MSIWLSHKADDVFDWACAPDAKVPPLYVTIAVLGFGAGIWVVLFSIYRLATGV